MIAQIIFTMMVIVVIMISGSGSDRFTGFGSKAQCSVMYRLLALYRLVFSVPKGSSIRPLFPHLFYVQRKIGLHRHCTTLRTIGKK